MVDLGPADVGDAGGVFPYQLRHVDAVVGLRHQRLRPLVQIRPGAPLVDAPVVHHRLHRKRQGGR